jgi:hypothetical protein
VVVFVEEVDSVVETELKAKGVVLVVVVVEVTEATEEVVGVVTVVPLAVEARKKRAHGYP